MINQLNGILASVAGSLTTAQLQSLQQQVLQLVLSQAGGNLNVNTLKGKLLALLKQYLGSNPQLSSNVQAVVQQVVNPTGAGSFQVLYTVLCDSGYSWQPAGGTSLTFSQTPQAAYDKIVTDVVSQAVHYGVALTKADVFLIGFSLNLHS